MNRSMAMLVCIALLLLSLPVVPARGAGGRSWTVIAGGGTKDMAVVSNAFHPRTVDVAVGDTVTWQFQGFHNVAFLGGTPLPPLEIHEGNTVLLNPQVLFPAGGRTYTGMGYANSGVPLDPAKPFSYALTFTKPGTYRYVCVVHGPGMGGTIVVKNKVSASPATVARQARQQQAATIRAGESLWKRHTTSRRGGDFVVPLVGDLRSGTSVMRFTREPLRVPVGATVTWVMQDPFEIHTVTFTGGKKPPSFELVQPQAQGPPKVLVNPLAAAPTGQRNYDGTGYVNSGILYPPMAPANLLKNYSLTFLRAGRYEYWCLTHASLGMKGVIIVQ